MILSGHVPTAGQGLEKVRCLRSGIEGGITLSVVQGSGPNPITLLFDENVRGLHPHGALNRLEETNINQKSTQANTDLATLADAKKDTTWSGRPGRPPRGR